MNDKEIREHIEVGLAAVLEAGPIALEYFRRPMTVTDKPGKVFDPVTEADRGIEAAIRRRLEARFPEHGIVGEEYGSRGQSSTYWVIDPIDGTRAFISGNPCWGILLGLVGEGRAVAGIMHQPFTGETFVADPERGARLLHAGKETRLVARAGVEIADAILYSTHPDMLVATGLLQSYETLAKRCRLQRWGGDCYSFALLALGCVDLVVEGSLNSYDIVPLIPIIEGAGGVVTDLEGNTPLQGGNVVAAANAKIHQAAVEILASR